MKKSSAKQKGNRLESEIAKYYQNKIDKYAKRMPTSGAIEGFKGDILKRFRDGWSDECKSRANIAIYDWWKQAVDQAGEYDKPVLHIKADHKEILTIIRVKDYFDMREELYDWNNMRDDIVSEVKEEDLWKKTEAYNKIKAGINLVKQGLSKLDK